MYFWTALAVLIFCTILCHKFKRKKRPLLATVLVLTFIYIFWRVTAVPTDSIVNFTAGAVLLTAEFVGLTQFLSFLWMFSSKYSLERKDLSDFGTKPVPKVDILICTYNESLELLKKTITTAIAVRYPEGRKQIYVCDDGGREELHTLCRTFGVNYLSRSGNEGAKAGNINHALSHTEGELFVVLDADMLLLDCFLEETIGYFADSQVAFLQTPQAYYNQDMYQYNLKKKIPNEQDFFMRDVEEARAAHNAVLHVGTNAVFRKEHVLGVGGYPTCSITEDMALGMLLQGKGYRTIFLKKVLAVGLSATTFSELLTQRDRWCRGNLQVVKNHNPLKIKRFTFTQKLAYVEGVIYWCTSIQKMVFLLAPILYLLFGIRAMSADLKTFLLYFVPCFLGQILAFRAIAPSTRSMYWSHVYEVAMAPHISRSVIRELFGIETGFSVTPKNVTATKAYYQLKAALPHIILLILTLLAWAVGLIGLNTGEILLGALLLNLFWSVYNSTALYFCCRLAYQKPIHRKTERVRLKERIPVTVQSKEKQKKGIFYDISDCGSRILMEDKDSWAVGEEVVLKLENVRIPATVARGNERFLALEFKEPDIAAYKRIMAIYMNNIHEYYIVSNKEYEKVRDLARKIA